MDKRGYIRINFHSDKKDDSLFEQEKNKKKNSIFLKFYLLHIFYNFAL